MKKSNTDGFITHYELGFDNDDFDFEIIKIGDDYYNHLSPFTPKQKTKVRVNNCSFEITTQLENVEEFLSGFGYNQKIIDNVKQRQIDDVKFKAILKYVNSITYRRKLKLEKINKINGDKS